MILIKSGMQEHFLVHVYVSSGRGRGRKMTKIGEEEDDGKTSKD